MKMIKIHNTFLTIHGWLVKRNNITLNYCLFRNKIQYLPYLILSPVLVALIREYPLKPLAISPIMKRLIDGGMTHWVSAGHGLQ